MANALQTRDAGLENWLASAPVRKKFDEVLQDGAPAFLTSLLSLVKATPQLAGADPETVVSAAMTAATLKLPINSNLGFAYLVPYRGKNGTEAQFQMGWRGFVQLAMRTGQYRTINAAVAYEGQVREVDFVTGEIVRGEKKSNKVAGFVAYFELVNGFKKTLYMTVDEMETHAKRYSQSYRRGFGVWRENFEMMGLKTVLKRLISRYGIMSIDMQGANLAQAVEVDQAVIGDSGAPIYVDNGHDAPPVFVEPKAEPKPVKAKEEAPSEAPAEDEEPAF